MAGSGSTGSGQRLADDLLAISVHGPAGVLDLVVPDGAVATDVAREYARQSGLGSIPLLHTAAGGALPPAAALVSAGVESGDLLVATTGIPRPARRGDRTGAVSTDPMSAGPLAALWCAVAAGVAGFAAWLALPVASAQTRESVAIALFAAVLIGVAPFGPSAPLRALVAPVFAAAAGLVVVWDATPERLPMVVGVAALAGAVVAAVARSLARERDDVLTVWMVLGSTVFVFAGLAAVIGLNPQAVWALLVVLAMLGARFVPGFAIDVPDEVLLDLDRLAVTAWSARERPTGRRGRMIVRRPAVAAIVARGARIVAASSVGIFVIVAVAAPMLLATATTELDRIGARTLVFFAGAALLLAARSFRHTVARAFLRAAGLVCWVAVTTVLLPGLGAGAAYTVVASATVLAAVVVLAGVATGRGWRSVWWSRRAEIAEALCNAFAIASLCVASGLFRFLWELISVVFRR